MDPRDRSVDELVEQFISAPGSAESEQLDFKAKEIIDDTDGKRDLAKKAAAIANTAGGSIIVGVGEGSREDIIQSFGSRSEITRDLANVFRDNTKPPLDRYAEIKIEELSNGPRLLRIDIQPADSHPVEFYDRDAKEYIPFHRVEDTTRKMGTTDLAEFSTKRTHAHEFNGNEIIDSICIDISDIEVYNDSNPRKTPRNRAILNIDCHGLVVPAAVHLNKPFQKSLTYHLEKRVGEGISALQELLEVAREELNADLGHEFGYGIKYGSKQLIGRNADNYVSDINQLDQTLEWLGCENDTDPRPVAVAGTRCDFGFIWFQAQYRTESLKRIKCGLILSDIPLHTATLRRVFGENWFEQDNSLRTLRIRLDGDEVPLTDTRTVLLDESGSVGRTELIANNPYFKNDQALRDSVTRDAYGPFIDAISSVDRLPFTVRAGFAGTDAYHTIGEIQMSQLFASVPTYFVWPMCIPHDN